MRSKPPTWSLSTSRRNFSEFLSRPPGPWPYTTCIHLLLDLPAVKNNYWLPIPLQFSFQGSVVTQVHNSWSEVLGTTYVSEFRHLSEFIKEILLIYHMFHTSHISVSIVKYMTTYMKWDIETSSITPYWHKSGFVNKHLLTLIFFSLLQWTNYINSLVLLPLTRLILNLPE